MKAALLVIVSMLVGAAGVYHFFLSPKARHEREALRLIRTLRMDESDLVSFVSIFDRSLAKGRISQQQHHCIVDITRADIARMQARGVSAYLNEAELKKASAFFESTAGQKVLQYLHLEMMKRDPAYPIQVSGASPEFDIDEMEQMASFRRTPTGAKVYDVASVMQQTETEMIELIRDRKAECGAPVT